jgi:hypothetical protein
MRSSSSGRGAASFDNAGIVTMTASTWDGAALIVWRLRMSGLSQREAAAMVGCSRRYWQSLEAGKRPVPIMLKLAAERLLDRRERLRAWLQRPDRRGGRRGPLAHTRRARGAPGAPAGKPREVDPDAAGAP